MNNNTILALVFLMAGTLLTTTAVTTMGVPAAYAEGDNDNDDDNGDGNKQKVEEESAGSIADCDDNEVERAGFDCVAVAEIGEGANGGGNGEEEIVLCHNPANGPPQTLTVQNEQQAAAHLDTDVPGHEDDHLGECGAGET
jgi:hypothetical protein